MRHRRLLAALGLAMAATLCAAPDHRATTLRQIGVIIDTDAGSDDLMAIAFLLTRRDARIEAITIVNGLAHVRPGAGNVLRLLELAGRRDIPVYVGREKPLKPTAEFPAEWRKLSDTLPGVELPQASRQPERETAAEYLAKRLADPRHRSRILALGPLTNLAEALERAQRSARGIQEIIIMGGALRVPGNLGDGGYFKTDNTTAEWNMFVDPLAAQKIFAAGAPIRLVPLDATNKVRIDPAFLREFEARARTPLGKFAVQVLESDREYIEMNIFFAWDPLAAVALVEPAVLETRAAAIEIRQKPPEEGRTAQVAGRRPNAQVAWNADAAAFKRIFLAALASGPGEVLRRRR